MNTIKYSKEVMQNFLHPKNMGKIENADGVGKVGNIVCLLPNEKIQKNSESVEIAKLENKQKVLTHTGFYEEILKTASREYDGSIIFLKNKLGNIKLTPEHLVYALKLPKGQKFQRNKGKRQLIPSWHHAENLEKGDIILYPLLKKEEDINFLEINIPKAKYDFKSKEIANKVLLNNDLLRLFGYFLAEGNVQDKPRRTCISLTLNIKENDIVEDIKQISKRLFDIDIKIKEMPEKKLVVVYLYNARLARWFKSLFGDGAEHKKLPNFIMNLPAEKQKSLICGLWKGEGYISYQLAQQIKTLLLRQKIVPSIYEGKEKEIKGVRHKKSYIIQKSYTSVDSWFDNNYLYTPITNKEILGYKGLVNNLEVKNAHSFTSEAFCLHNCGDIMYVYIKVGKRKKDGKEEEYIKDVKFQTLGCAAAIATSSMITQLAKGKSIEDAMKLTRNNVAESLQGLPPIKMHCSNLAADALHAAVLNYYEKQGNKEMLEKYAALRPHDDEHDDEEEHEH